jgi:hypothetical protein
MARSKVVAKKKKAPTKLAEAQPLKLDLGCGKNIAPGFEGVDVLPFDGVKHVVHLGRDVWPWDDHSVDEAHSSHFLEHLTPVQRVHFFNELGRVLKIGAVARIITPHWSNACAYGDPTHQWPPISEWTYQYTHKGWRESNAPHVDTQMAGEFQLTCNFDHVIGGTWTDALNGREESVKAQMMTNYINCFRDIIATLTNRGP